VDCQRAEAHLRLLAEEELRRPAWAWGERRARVGRVAQLLTAMDALDDEVADRILTDFDLALVARQPDAPGRRGLAAVSQRRSAAARFRPAMPVSSQSPASGQPGDGQSRRSPAARRRGQAAREGRPRRLPAARGRATVRAAGPRRRGLRRRHRGPAGGRRVVPAQPGTRAVRRARPTAAPPRPSRCPNSTGSRSRFSACTTARAAPSCTCTPAAR
jgi:hypothetical protein